MLAGDVRSNSMTVLYFKTAFQLVTVTYVVRAFKLSTGHYPIFVYPLFSLRTSHFH